MPAHELPRAFLPHDLYCGPEQGFRVCYCYCPECADEKGRCICHGCGAYHPGVHAPDTLTTAVEQATRRRWGRQ